MQNLRVLIVEEEVIISDYLRVSLQQRGFEVIGTPRSIDEAIEGFRERRPDLMILDTQLSGQPEMVQAARMIRAEFQMNIPIVFLTTFRVERSQTEQSHPCVKKPFSEEEFYSAIESALGDRGGAYHESGYFEPL